MGCRGLRGRGQPVGFDDVLSKQDKRGAVNRWKFYRHVGYRLP